MILIGNQITDSSKVANMMHGNVIGGITEADTMKVERFIKGFFYTGQDNRPHGRDSGQDENVNRN